MARQRWLILVALAVLGYGSLWWLYPRFSPAAEWRYQLNRDLALERARAVAREFGVETNGWREQVAVSRDRENPLGAYLQQRPAPAFTEFFGFTQTNVTLTSASSADTIRIRLNPAGRLLRFNWSRRAERNEDPEDAPGAAKPAATITPAEQNLVETTFQKLTGAQRALFTTPPQVSHELKQVKHTWTAGLANDSRLSLSVEISTRGEQLRGVSINPIFSEEFKNANRSTTLLDLLDTANAILLLPLGILCLVVFFVGWGNGELLHRPALWLLALATLFLLLVNQVGPFYDDLNIDIPLPQPWLTSLIVRAFFTLIMFCFALPLYFFWASGHSLTARQAQRRTVAFELLLQGRLLTRFLAQNVAAGILLGGVIAVIPFWLKLLPGFQAAPFSVRSGFELFTSQSPALATLANEHAYGVFLFFAFAVPLVEYYVSRKLIARGLLLLMGIFWFLGNEYFPSSTAPALLTGFCLSVAYYGIYRQFDFLAVILAALSNLVALQSLTLLAQPMPSLHTSAWTALSGLSLALLASTAVAWRGRPIPEETFAPLLKTQLGAERERLKAELEVAQRAQQQMLPDEPPQLPGFDIAAICRPSKDVGGDLYDFINLPDGRLGIVVADVSGKGVPAALYMTLTKGLLASVAVEKSDPGDILREVNRHLYEACRKKVFVTLFLGVLDPFTRTLTYARAGHNPTVWRSPSQGTTELLRPGGMGLGLNQGKIFNTTLKVATLQLAPDDALLFYSDGITEAMNAKQEEYGEERLMAVAAQTDALKASATLDTIMADVKAFLGSIAPQDDQTLVVLKVC